MQSHVSYLRTLLGNKNAIVGRPPGYQLDVGDDGTDVWLAERLLRQGAQAADPVRGASDLRAALALWRGRPLADVTGLAWLEEQAGRLELLAERIRRALSEARLAAGEHRQLIGELEEMATAHPLDEQVYAQLMTALYRSGRQADALAAYQRLRSTLADELGLVPGQALRDLETAILRQDSSLDAPAPAPGLLVRPAEPPAAAFYPAQLPPPVAAFVGRGAELASLDAILPGPEDGAAISVIAGTAGVGKTALALHWAHRVAARFPDGQLYVNLRGFDPGNGGRTTSQALRGFLDAFGVPPERHPGHAEALAGALPQPARRAGGCSCCSTTRGRRAGAPAAARLTRLPGHRDQPQPPRRAGRRPGGAPAAPGPAAPGGRPASCSPAGWAQPDQPGAGGGRGDHRHLRAAAAGADHRRRPRRRQPILPLAAVAADLREAAARARRVRRRRPGHRRPYRLRLLLPGAQRRPARLFRLLGLHPGPDISVGAAAGLAGIAPDRVAACWPSWPAGTCSPSSVPAGMRFTTCCARTRPSRRTSTRTRRPGGPPWAGSSTTACRSRAPLRR